jgi:superfamily I DNA/RNA helicase
LLNPGDLASLLVYLQGGGIFTAGRQQKVLESYAASDKSLSSLIRIMKAAGLPPQKEDKLQEFIAMLRKYEPMVKEKKPGEIIVSWINDNGLSGMRCMELLLDTSVMYEDTASFIHNLLLGQESDIVRSGNRKYTSDAVSLMTIHSAKGLEFPVVFVCGVNDGTIPLKKGRSGFHTDIDEERRLFYVGITRAQDELILLTGRNPSPFINDIRGIPEVQYEAESRSTSKQKAQYKQVSLFEM